MPQVTNSSVSLKTQARTHRTVVIAALLALAATASIVLVVAIAGDSSRTASLAGKAQPALRADSGPNESAVASAIATPSRTSSGPSESSVAAAVAGSTVRPIGGPDESSVAASVSQAQPVAGRRP